MEEGKAKGIMGAVLLGIEMGPEDEVLGIWNMAFPDFEWMGLAIAKGGYVEGAYRFRYYDPDDPGNPAFSGKDRKSSYAVGPVQDTPKERARMVNALSTIYELGSPASREHAHFPGGTLEEAMDWVMAQPWAHVQTEGKA